MKLRPLLFPFFLVAMIGCAVSAEAQSQTKTIVLARHAEKAVVPPTEPDPDLSAEGKARAERLMKAIVRKYKPHEIFATDYKRTKQTAEPTALKRKKPIQTYDPSKPADLIARIMPTKTDHHLIVGHSNTIPVLANLLMKKEVFRNLPEPEYGVFWVIKMKNGVVKKVEVVPY